MSEEKATRQKKKATEDVVEESKVLVAPPVVRRVGKSLSFEQWAKLRNVRPQHMRGMRAHVRDVHRSRPASEWDQVFSTY